MQLSYDGFFLMILWFVGVTLWVQLCGRYSQGFFNCLENMQLALIWSIEVALFQVFTYNGSLRKFNQDQGCWPMYCRWPLLRGDHCEGFHCIFLSSFFHTQLFCVNMLCGSYIMIFDCATLYVEFFLACVENSLPLDTSCSPGNSFTLCRGVISP